MEKPMKKIPTLYQRDPENMSRVLPIISPGCEWVSAEEGIATRKFDGTCCLVRNGALYKRYERRPNKSVPSEWEPADEIDEASGKQPGWVPVGPGPEDRYHRESFGEGMHPDGTYELVGPKIQGNPERFSTHTLVLHGAEILPDCPREYVAIREFLYQNDIEGIVFHHSDGRMAKIKGRDFGVYRRGNT
jgi:hypothetical protein